MNVALPEEVREKIAARLCREINLSNQARGQLPDRWRANKDTFHGMLAAQAQGVISGVAGYTLPMLKPKAIRIVNNTYSAITSIKPIVQAMTMGQRVITEDSLERTLQFLVDKSNWAKEFKKTIRSSYLTNLGVLRVAPKYLPKEEGGDVCGIECDEIPPERMVIYPMYCRDFGSATTIGHEYHELRYQVKQKISDRLYYDVDQVKLAGSDLSMLDKETSGADRMTSFYESASSTDDAIRIYELITYIDLSEFKDKTANDIDRSKAKRYLAKVAVDSGQLLALEPYGVSIVGLEDSFEEFPVWYIEHRMSYESGSIWPEDAPATSMQQIQNIGSSVFTTIVQGAQMSAFPPTFAVGSPIDSKFKAYAPGDIIPLPEGTTIMSIPAQARLEALPVVMQMLEKIADSLTGISRLSTGERLPSGTTATEANLLGQAAMEAKDEYVDAISPAVSKTFELVAFYLKTYFPSLKECYPDGILLDDPSQIDIKRLIFEVTNASGNSNPQALIQKMMMLLQMAMQPGSQLDPVKIQREVLNMMDLPLNPDALLKPPMQDMQMGMQQMVNPEQGQAQTPLDLDSLLKSYMAEQQPQ